MSYCVPCWIKNASALSAVMHRTVNTWLDTNQPEFDCALHTDSLVCTFTVFVAVSMFAWFSCICLRILASVSPCEQLFGRIISLRWVEWSEDDFSQDWFASLVQNNELVIEFLTETIQLEEFHGHRVFGMLVHGDIHIYTWLIAASRYVFAFQEMQGTSCIPLCPTSCHATHIILYDLIILPSFLTRDVMSKRFRFTGAYCLFYRFSLLFLRLFNFVSTF